MRAVAAAAWAAIWLFAAPVIPFRPGFSRGGSNGYSTFGRSRGLPPLELFGRTPSSIPSSAADRDRRAIESVKAAIAKPKSPSFPLVECEFPPLAELNKLGDGSMRSAQLVDDVRTVCDSLAIKTARSPDDNFHPSFDGARRTSRSV